MHVMFMAAAELRLGLVEVGSKVNRFNVGVFE